MIYDVSSMSRFGWSLPAALCAFGLAAIPAFAQFRGGVTGTVTDPTGSIVPGVKLTLTNEETQRKLETTSSNGGVYRFDSLAPGRYNVTATHKGFKETSEEVTVQAESVQQANISLETGTVTATVTVTAESSPSIETTNGNVGRSLTSQEVVHLPQIGRDPYELLRLTPGIFGDAARSGSGATSVPFPNTGGGGSAGPGGSNFSLFQVENQVPISADGQRITANNYLLDGVSVNSLQWGGAAVVTPNQESVKEIRVNANAYSAEYGRNSGAQIETVSKNGTNTFHGSALFLFQDPNFNAYNKPSGLPMVPVTRVENRYRNYAGSIGGPIKKDSLFFFFSLEGIREHTTTFTPNYVETPEFDAAVQRLRPNSLAAKIIGAPGSAPRIATVLPITKCPVSLLPNCQVINGRLDLGQIGGAAPSVPGVPASYFPLSSAGGGLDGIPDVEYADIASPTLQTGQQYNGRIDWSHDKDYVAGSVYYTTSNQRSTGNPLGRPNGDQVQAPLNAAVTLIYTRTLSPTMLNEARGNFTRFAFNQLANPGPTNYQIPEIDVQFPSFAQIQYGANRGDTSPGVFAQNTYEFRDSLSKILGSHSFKLGFELRREQDNNNLAGGARPVYSFQNLWNFANDAPVFEAIETNPATGGQPQTQHYFRTHVYALYLQDDWKVTRSLTLNLGVRWEYFGPLSAKGGNLYNWQFGPGIGNLNDSKIQRVSQLYNPIYDNVAPRFGFAFNPASNSWFVMRGGFGIMYNRTEDSIFALTRQDDPLSESFGLCCGNATTPLASNKQFPGGTIAYGLGTSNSIYSYPLNPATATGIDPTTNTPVGEAVQVYAVPQNFKNTYAYIYSLEADFMLPHRYVLTLGYQGSDTHHLVHLVDQNFLYPKTNNNFSDIFLVQPDVNANYNALNVTFSKPLAKGIQFQQNFRWAKSLDTNSAEGPGANTNSTYPIDLHTEYGPSDFDVKYTYTASGLIELPFFRDQKGIIGKVLGGWQVSPIFTFHTGFPWTPKTNAEQVQTPTGATLSPVRPSGYLCAQSGGPCPLSGQSNSAFLRPGGNFPLGGPAYFIYQTPSGFTTSPPGIGRNVFRSPWYKDVDFSIEKIVKFPNAFLGEASQLSLRLNLFNAFNQQDFAPFNFNDTSTLINQPQFGQPISELAGRSVELQARFSF